MVFLAAKLGLGMQKSSALPEGLDMDQIRKDAMMMMLTTPDAVEAMQKEMKKAVSQDISKYKSLSKSPDETEEAWKKYCELAKKIETNGKFDPATVDAIEAFNKFSDTLPKAVRESMTIDLAKPDVRAAIQEHIKENVKKE